MKSNHTISVPVRSVLELPPGPGNARNSEGAFLELKNGRILYAYSKFLEGNGCDHGKAVIAARWSDDRGETWTKDDRILAVNSVDPNGNVMSVSLLRINPNRIGLVYGQKQIDDENRIFSRRFLIISNDEGETWSETIEVTRDMPNEYRVVNNSRTLRLSTGRILIPFANHGLHPADRMNMDASIGCMYSDDDCLTWKRGNEFLTYKDGVILRTQEPGVVELNDGRVMIYFRTAEGRQWCAYSNDGALTWDEPKPMPLYSPLSPASIIRVSDGRLMAVWNDHEGRDDLRKAGPDWAYGVRTPLTIAFSSDEGLTWNDKHNIETGYDPEDYFHFWYCYTAIMELEDSYLLAYCAERNLQHSRIVKIAK